MGYVCVCVCVCARYLEQAGAEASEHLLHVASLLHGDDTQMVPLVHPDQEALASVVPERETEKERET